MKPTSNLHDLGQSLWLDNITRELLKDRDADRSGRSQSSSSDAFVVTLVGGKARASSVAGWRFALSMSRQLHVRCSSSGLARPAPQRLATNLVTQYGEPSKLR